MQFFALGSEKRKHTSNVVIDGDSSQQSEEGRHSPESGQDDDVERKERSGSPDQATHPMYPKTSSIEYG